MPPKTPTPQTPAEARRAAGLTQLELANMSGLTPSTIHRIEASGRWPSRVTTNRRLRAALGLGQAKP